MKLALPDRAALRDPVTRSATVADLPARQADDQGPAASSGGYAPAEVDQALTARERCVLGLAGPERR